METQEDQELTLTHGHTNSTAIYGLNILKKELKISWSCSSTTHDQGHTETGRKCRDASATKIPSLVQSPTTGGISQTENFPRMTNLFPTSASPALEPTTKK